MIALLFLFSLTQAAEEDLLALQIKTGSNSSLTRESAVPCPMPAEPDALSGGKKCGGNVCINENKKYSSVEEAWAACGTVKECGFVMESDGFFQLRRTTDPDAYENEARGYTYTCCQPPLDEEPRAGGKKCGRRTAKGPPKCINDNTPYDTLTEAWRACDKDKECGFVMKQARDSKYYIRRGRDPDIEAGEGYDHKCCAPPMVTARNDVGRKCAYFCINDNIGYMSLGEAWKKCGEVEECGSIWANPDKKYYLRRANDPKIEPQTLPDGNTTTSVGYKFDCTSEQTE